jgi:hypothetical protein
MRLRVFARKSESWMGEGGQSAAVSADNDLEGFRDAALATLFCSEPASLSAQG